MGPRLRRLLAELGRFLSVGVLATVVAVVLFNLLVHGFGMLPELMGEQPIPAYVLANTVGMVVSYRGSRGWAFRHRPPVQADGGLLAYAVINLATMVLPVLCLWFSREVLHLADPVSDNLAANVIGGVLGTLARFALFRTFVFRHPGSASPWHTLRTRTARLTARRGVPVVPVVPVAPVLPTAPLAPVTPLAERAPTSRSSDDPAARRGHGAAAG